MRHPIQPTEVDEHGTLWFKSNAIVVHLLNNGEIDMNDLAVLGFSNEDRQQFAQLIGYSLSGYSELESYVDEDALGVVGTMHETGLSEDKARIEYLETELAAIRKGLVNPVARLFGIHPEDLEVL